MLQGRHDGVDGKDYERTASMFPTNEGSLDRDVRIALGVMFAVVATFFLGGIWQIIAGVLAVILLATAALGFCPLYVILGINTTHSGHSPRH